MLRCTSSPNPSEAGPAGEPCVEDSEAAQGERSAPSVWPPGRALRLAIARAWTVAGRKGLAATRTGPRPGRLRCARASRGASKARSAWWRRGRHRSGRGTSSRSARRPWRRRGPCRAEPQQPQRPGSGQLGGAVRRCRCPRTSTGSPPAGGRPAPAPAHWRAAQPRCGRPRRTVISAAPRPLGLEHAPDPLQEAPLRVCLDRFSARLGVGTSPAPPRRSRLARPRRRRCRGRRRSHPP